MDILMSKSNSKGTRVVIKYDLLHIADYIKSFDYIQFGTIYSWFSNYNNYDLASNDNVRLKVYARMVNISGGVVIPININDLRVRVTNDKFNYHDFKGENGFIFVTKTNGDIFVEITNGKFVTERSINTKILAEDIGIKNINKLRQLFY